ncbi:hypothetical protein ACHQM5_006558 [Ranunculus cassubicifolius]
MKPLNILFVAFTLIALFFTTCIDAANSNLFREYIGADSGSIKLTDVPINPGVEFHFILAFALDYTDGGSPSNGKFNAIWDTDHIGAGEIASIKDTHKNVKVAVSLGGDSASKGHAYFTPKSIDSWVNNAVSSLTAIIKTYHLDGIDIDYEHFHSDPNTFAECIGQLVTSLKKSRLISFASIAPYEDEGPVQRSYEALWAKYGHMIDYVNFQFYAYDKGISVSQFVGYFNKQATNYGGGQILASLISDGSGGLPAGDEFFEACKELKGQGKLAGIFIWSADDSQKQGFTAEKRSQEFLASN